MKKLLLSLVFLCSFIGASAQITVLSSFNATAGGLCGIGYYPGSAVVWAYHCNNAAVNSYDTTGVLFSTFATPGGVANDVDIEIAPEQFLMNGSLVPEGQLLFINGESGSAEIYSVDTSSGTIADTLTALFGNDHVVGGAFHPQRNSFFLVQDNVPSAALEMLISEIDPSNGDTLNQFQITPYFNVSYGDLEVGANGNLFVVSSVEDSIAEFTPTGLFVQMHDLPSGVSDLSGIALDCSLGQAWVCNTAGVVFRLGNFPCGVAGINEATDFQFHEVHPNPFSSEFSFSLTMNSNQKVFISLSDISGRTCDIIYNEDLPAGNHEFVFNHDAVPGLYILNIRTANSFLSRKVICTK